MLDQECKENIYRVLVSNKADLGKKRRMLATEGMRLSIENGMHKYFEVSAIQNYNVDSTIADVIKALYEN